MCKTHWGRRTEVGGVGGWLRGQSPDMWKTFLGCEVGAGGAKAWGKWRAGSDVEEVRICLGG